MGAKIKNETKQNKNKHYSLLAMIHKKIHRTITEEFPWMLLSVNELIQNLPKKVVLGKAINTSCANYLQYSNKSYNLLCKEKQNQHHSLFLN